MQHNTIPLADMPFEAAAFAARAHQHQKRKDNQTPYVSHVFRVCLVVRHTFGFDDPRMLAAALLHDTIEDTATDCDDILSRFGEDVAKAGGVFKSTVGLEEGLARMVASGELKIEAASRARSSLGVDSSALASKSVFVWTDRRANTSSHPSSPALFNSPANSSSFHDEILYSHFSMALLEACCTHPN